MITYETRNESNGKTEEMRPILYTKIINILSTGESLTANEIAKRINKKWNRQNTQPRLHELKNKYKLVETDGKKHDYETNREVVAYKLIERSKNEM